MRWTFPSSSYVLSGLRGRRRLAFFTAPALPAPCDGTSATWPGAGGWSSAWWGAALAGKDVVVDDDSSDKAAGPGPPITGPCWACRRALPGTEAGTEAGPLPALPPPVARALRAGSREIPRKLLLSFSSAANKEEEEEEAAAAAAVGPS